MQIVRLIAVFISCDKTSERWAFNTLPFGDFRPRKQSKQIILCIITQAGIFHHLENIHSDQHNISKPVVYN